MTSTQANAFCPKHSKGASNFGNALKKYTIGHCQRRASFGIMQLVVAQLVLIGRDRPLIGSHSGRSPRNAALNVATPLCA